jgi:zinc transporter ZupT
MGGMVVGGLALLAGFGVQLVEMVLVGEGGAHGGSGHDDGYAEVEGGEYASDHDDDKDEDDEEKKMLSPKRRIKRDYGSFNNHETISTTTTTNTDDATETNSTTVTSSDEDTETDLEAYDTDFENQSLQCGRPNLTTKQHQNHHHRRRPSQSASRSLPISILILESSIMFHSLIIGLTLGLSPDSNIKMLVVAMALHQFFEGVALGSLISTSTTTTPSILPKLINNNNNNNNEASETKPTKNRTKKQIHSNDSESGNENEGSMMKIWGLGMLYPLTTPLGILVGILIRCLHFLPSSASSSPSFIAFHGNTNGDSSDAEGNPSFKLLQGVLNSLSAGVLMYNVYTELLGTEVNHHRGFQKSSRWFKLVCLGSMYAGAVVLGVLGLWV